MSVAVSTCDLTLKIVKYYQGFYVNFKILSNSHHVRDGDMLNVLDQGLLIDPAFRRVSDTPMRWTIKVRVTLVMRRRPV